MTTPQKVPVSILTGFLGSGKTTLLNRILSEEHGKRIAVIENEYGEVGIDQALVINADEEIFEMSNGCICCTVRGRPDSRARQAHEAPRQIRLCACGDHRACRSRPGRPDLLHGRRNSRGVLARRDRHARRCSPHRAAAWAKRREHRADRVCGRPSSEQDGPRQRRGARYARSPASRHEPNGASRAQREGERLRRHGTQPRCLRPGPGARASSYLPRAGVSVRLDRSLFARCRPLRAQPRRWTGSGNVARRRVRPGHGGRCPPRGCGVVRAAVRRTCGAHSARGKRFRSESM